jgi:FixJ family two-component response regulator
MCIPGASATSSSNRFLSLIDPSSSFAHGLAMESQSRLEGGRAIDRVLVAVVDDDESIRDSLPDLIREFGFAAQAYPSAEEFLASDNIGQTKCLVLDITMPGMSGLALQRELKARGRKIPIVFITASKDEKIRAQASQDGTVEVLLKPFSDTALLAALKKALRMS